MAGLDPVATQRARHGLRRRALHSLSLALARNRGLIAHARRLAGGRRDRVARIAALFEFVHRLAAAEALRRAPAVAVVPGLREDDLAAAVLWAMLRATGERASVEYTREMAFVRVAVAFADVRLLPPWARLVRSRAGGIEIALAPAGRWRPAGYLPPDVHAGLQRRRLPVAIAS